MLLLRWKVVEWMCDFDRVNWKLSLKHWRSIELKHCSDHDRAELSTSLQKLTPKLSKLAVKLLYSFQGSFHISLQQRLRNKLNIDNESEKLFSQETYIFYDCESAAALHTNLRKKHVFFSDEWNNLTIEIETDSFSLSIKLLLSSEPSLRVFRFTFPSHCRHTTKHNKKCVQFSFSMFEIAPDSRRIDITHWRRTKDGRTPSTDSECLSQIN